MLGTIRRALRFLKVNFKGYLLLSVTIVFSFSILLGYLVYTDSGLYNNYKEILQAPSNVVLAYELNDNRKAQLLLDRILSESGDQRKTPQYYQYLKVGIQLPQYGDVYASLYLMPAGETEVFRNVIYEQDGDESPILSIEQVNVTAGDKSFGLTGQEAIISQNLFDALSGGEKQLPIDICVPIEITSEADGTASTRIIRLKVVGICENSGNDTELSYNDIGNITGAGTIYCSQTILGNDILSENAAITRYTLICSDDAETVAAEARGLGLITHAACSAINEARKNIRNGIGTKALIAVVLLVLLGINMFSCMTNVIRNRRYEIGVQRALGASSGMILLQFLTESVIVMLLDLIASAGMIADIAIVYKAIHWMQTGEEWTVTLTSYSAMIYLICCGTVILVFSLFLAWRATQVVITEEIRAE